MDYMSHKANVFKNAYAAVVQNPKESTKENDETR
jgi:hypothetical protein